MEIVNSDENFGFKLSFVKGRNKNQRADEIINPIDFMSVKGVSATGNMLSRYKVKNISLVEIQNSLESPDNLRKEITNSESNVSEDLKIKKNINNLDDGQINEFLILFLYFEMKTY